jgi:hypothetical protein
MALAVLQEQAYRRLRRELLTALVLRKFLIFGTASFFVGGSLSLILRIMHIDYDLVGLPVIAALLFALEMAYFRGKAKLPDRKQLLARLDQLGGHRGMLLFLEEFEDNSWPQKSVTKTGIKVAFKSHGQLLRFFISAVFVIAVFVVPVKENILRATAPLNIGAEKEQLLEKIDFMQREKVIDEDSAEELRRQLNELETSAEGETPAKTWEGLDHMNERLNRKTEEVAENLVEKAEEMALTEAAARELLNSKQAASNAKFSESAAAIADLLRQLAAACPQIDPELANALKQCSKGGKINRDQLKKLLEGGEKTRKLLKQLLDKMRKRGMCNMAGGSQPGTDAQVLELTEENIKKLLKMLDEAGKKPGGGACQALNMFILQLPFGGKAGIGRGRGDAPMTWRKRQLDENTKWQEVEIPPPSAVSLKKSQVVGVSWGAEKANPSAKVSTGHLSGTGVSGSEAHRHLLLPRHRRPVNKYFSSGR